MVKEQSKEEKSIPYPKLLVPIRRSSNPLLNRPLNPKLSMEVPNSLGFYREKPQPKRGKNMNPILRTILTFAGTTSPVAIIYHFWPGFEHIGTSGTGSQPTAAAISTIVFLVTFFTAVQLTPKKPERCPECGYSHEPKKFVNTKEG